MTSPETDYLLRLFDPKADYLMIAEWHLARGMEALPKTALPKLGVVTMRRESSEPVAASWVFMDNSGTGVCFLEGTVSKPGLSFLDARGAITAAVGFLKSEVARMGYSTMITFCDPALARCAKRAGFAECKTNLVMLAATTAGGNE